MSVGAQQMKWAVLLQMREQAPGTLQFDDADRWGDVCVDDALGAFSRDVTTGSLEERVAAVEALGWMLDPRAASPLVRALSDSTPEVRRGAARAFSSFLPGPEWTVDALLDTLNDTDAGVRFYAVGALVRHAPCPRSAVHSAESPAIRSRWSDGTPTSRCAERRVRRPRVVHRADA